MKMLQKQLFILLIIYISESSCIINDLYDAGTEIWKFYSTIDELNLISSFTPRTVAELFDNDYGMNEKIIDQMVKIHVKLLEIEHSINFNMKNNLLKFVRSTVIALKCVDVMEIFIESIDEAYKIFYQIVVGNDYIYGRPLNNLTESVFPNIESNIGMIRKVMTHPEDLFPGESSLIAAIDNYAKTRSKEICNIYQSIDEILVHLFKITIVAEIKTSVMLIYDNLHQYRENQAWKIMNTRAKMRFRKYFESYVTTIQQTLNLTTGLYMRACDPTDGAWILNENYYELDGISQAMIFRYQPTMCPFKSCQNIWKNRATRCDARYYDKRSGCSSTPADCEDFGTMQACVTNSGIQKFQYVNSSKLGFFGSNAKCPEDDGYILDNRSGTHAGYATCACHCDRNHNKISLVIMESRGDLNEVIIGLRLKRRNNILHIQPRVGVLMANGFILRNSESWLPIPNDIDASQIHPVDKDNSLFFLDDVLLPPKFVLTGAGFNKVTRGTVTGFAIEIFGTPFDHKSGQLYFLRRIQLAPSRSNSGRPLSFYPISPLQAKKYNTPSSPDWNYVQLQQSALRSDFGQSMLPLFDAVPVTTDPPSPLGGMGIFHKGVKGYGGFISLKAYGIRYEQYFENFTSAHTIEGRLQLFT